MRDPERIHAITTALYLLWSETRNQDLRLGQLLYDIGYHNVLSPDIFNIEDDVWLDWILKKYESGR